MSGSAHTTRKRQRRSPDAKRAAALVAQAEQEVKVLRRVQRALEGRGTPGPRPGR